MKTKFIDIPKEDRQAIWVMALDALHAFEKHVPDIRRLRYNNRASPPLYLYKLSLYQHLRYYGTPDNVERIEFVSKYKEGSVMFVVTDHEWPRKLFLELHKAKNETPHERGEKDFLKKLDDDMFNTRYEV